jgi:hypothetical protein
MNTLYLSSVGTFRCPHGPYYLRTECPRTTQEQLEPGLELEQVPVQLQQQVLEQEQVLQKLQGLQQLEQ